MDAETIVGTILGEELDMVDDDIEQMKHDVTGCYHDSMGPSTGWVSPELIYNLMMRAAERVIEQTTSKAGDRRLGGAKWHPRS